MCFSKLTIKGPKQLLTLKSSVEEFVNQGTIAIISPYPHIFGELLKATAFVITPNDHSKIFFGKTVKIRNLILKTEQSNNCIGIMGIWTPYGKIKHQKITTKVDHQNSSRGILHPLVFQGTPYPLC